MINEQIFKALADPTRRKILRMLNSGEMTAGELNEKFHISGPSMSHHFNVLKQADLVFVRRQGQQLFYSLNTTVFQDLMSVLLDIFAKEGRAENQNEN